LVHLARRRRPSGLKSESGLKSRSMDDFNRLHLRSLFLEGAVPAAHFHRLSEVWTLAARTRTAPDASYNLCLHCRILFLQQQSRFSGSVNTETDLSYPANSLNNQLHDDLRTSTYPQRLGCPMQERYLICWSCTLITGSLQMVQVLQRSLVLERKAGLMRHMPSIFGSRSIINCQSIFNHILRVFK